jgi:hypothetical protein
MHGLLPNRVPLTYDFLIDTQGRFDARIEIFGENGSATLASTRLFYGTCPRRWSGFGRKIVEAL